MYKSLICTLCMNAGTVKTVPYNALRKTCSLWGSIRFRDWDF